MPTYHCWSGGSNTAPYDTWAKAATTLTTAVGAANANADIIKVHKTHTEEVAGDITFTFLANVAVICVDKDASDALATMGVAAWIGNSTVNRSVNIGGSNRNLFFHGITLRTAGSSIDHIVLATNDGMHVDYESCYFWSGTTSSTATIIIGAADSQTFVNATNCTLRFGNVAQSINCIGRAEFIGGSVSSAGSAPTALVRFTIADPGGGSFIWSGGDLSHLAANALVGDASTVAATATFERCRLGSGYVMLDTQTHLNLSGAEVFVLDCSSGDTHGLFGYQNALGSVVSDAGIFFTSGAAAQSWRIVTTANCSYYTPFTTPWLGYYNTVTTAITPYAEILRDGSTTAFQDDEVWCEVLAKVTDASTLGTPYSDRMTLLGTPANQAAGAGLGSWTGEGGSAWSGKVGLNASITPAEVGHISMRFVVGEPSITVYADPQIRT